MTSAAIETQQRKLEALVALVEAAIDQLKGELDAKLTKLRTHWEKARGRQKERIDAATTSTEEHFHAQLHCPRTRIYPRRTSLSSRGST